MVKHTSLFLLFILIAARLQAQLVCHFGNISGSNDFRYPQQAVDSLLQPGRYAAIIFGETHSDHFEPAFKFHFLKHLNEAYGFRDVFVETGHALAWLYNRYLETGDTAFFHPLGPGRAYTPGYMWPGYRTSFWQQLYDYNRTLPASRRFIFHGTDFERKEALGVLLLLLPKDRAVPEPLAPVFAEIRILIADTGWHDFTSEAADKYARVRAAFIKDDAAVQALYGPDYAVVRSIIDNTAKQQTNWRPRNKTMSAEISKAVTALGIKQLVGFYGSAHTGYKTPSAIPNQVSRMDGFTGRTLNIVSVYYNVANDYSHDTIPLVRPPVPASVCMDLYGRILTKAYRAALAHASISGEPSFPGYADYILLANDTAAP